MGSPPPCFLLIVIFKNYNFFGSSQVYFYQQVYPMYKAFIEPDLQTAHIKIINKFNPFTGFQSPTYILKVIIYVIHTLLLICCFYQWFSNTTSLSTSITECYLLLQSTRMVTEDKVKAVFSENHTETKEQTYDIYLLPPGEDPESCQSYLRMRNKDGKYSLMFEVCLLKTNYYCSYYWAS